VASLFISHSSSDRDAARRLGERLRAEGFAALFLDFDPEQCIPAGRNWERELYAQLRKTDAVIFLASTVPVASRWCFAEVNLARLLGKPVFPLRLDGDAWLKLLDDTQWVDLAGGERAYARLWEGLRRAGLAPADSFSWDPSSLSRSGAVCFGDAAVFFGRDPRSSDRWKLSRVRTTKSVGTQLIYRLRIRCELKECSALKVGEL
jgi:TIR domain